MALDLGAGPNATDVQTRDVEIEHDGFRLRGTYELPACKDLVRDGRLPVVILAHGIKTHRHIERFDRMSAALAACGFATLRFDCAGRGDSDGDFKDMTLPGEIADLEAILVYARSLPQVDASRIALLGHSQGGLTASVLAGRHAHDDQTPYGAFAALVLTSPAGGMIRDKCKHGSFAYQDEVGAEYVRTARKLHVYKEAKHYHGPVCIFYGLSDELVQMGYIEKYRKAYRRQADVHMLAGASHGLEERYTDVITITKQFLLASIK